MKKHTENFKREAVRIALSSGLSRRRVASDLGVGLSTLGKWVCAYLDARGLALSRRHSRPSQPPRRGLGGQ